jgi:heme-degrading monooxygenase HmoA
MEGVQENDFLAAAKAVYDEILFVQKGFISWEVFRNEETWVDLVTWETSQDAKNGETAGAENPLAHKFYAMIDMESCTNQLFTFVSDYQQ